MTTNSKFKQAVGVFAAASIAVLTSTPAFAGSSDGNIQVKVLGTAVLPDGEITSVTTDTIGLPAGSQTELNGNVVPTIAVEYFATPNFSIETICCFTQHHLNGVDALAGARIVDHIRVLPATVTLKYHLATQGPIRPYVGAGPAMFFYIDERPGSTATSLGIADMYLEDQVGLAIQAGVDVPLNDNGLALSLDAKRYFVDTTAHFFDGTGAEVLTTEHDVSPWVLSAGFGYRF